MTDAARPLLLSELLTQSFDVCKKNIGQILIIAAIFGSIAFGVQTWFGTQIAGHAGNMMEKMGIDMERVEELSELAQSGDEAAQQELMEIAQGLDIEDDANAQEKMAMAGLGLLMQSAPSFILLMIAMFLLGTIAMAYYAILAMHGPAKFIADTPGYILPFLGLQIWLVLRTFVWIPIIGFIPAIILGPRFVASYVLLVKEKKGIVESASESYRRTEGYWGKIIGNGIVAGLCIILASILVSIVFGIVGFMTIPFAQQWLMSVLQYVFMAYIVTFSVLLSQTILAHPRSAMPPR